MLSKKANPTNPKLDEIILNLEDALIGEDETSDTYTKMVSNLETLYKLRSGHKPSKTELKDWIPAMGSLGGILAIIIFESFGHTMTSKAIGFVGKLKS